MALSLTGKIVIPILVLAVIGALTALIVIIVQDGDSGTTEAPTTSTTVDPSTTTPAETTASDGTTTTSDGTTTTSDGTTTTSDGTTTTSEGTTTTSAGTTTSSTSTTTEGPSKEIKYRVGVGIADMTGPCVEINFMGYAEISQSGRGLHLRQFSRAFIFVQGNTRVVLVTAEVISVGIAVRREVVKNLRARYGDIYNLNNVILTGTHTHSAPGGHQVDFLLDITILGFSQETFDAYVAGITRSIVRAHENLVPARLFFGQTSLLNIKKNRSPYSYNNNPAEERGRYTDNTDDILTQVRIEKEDGSTHGVLNWYPIHTTSMNMSNHLISSDNLGYAALRLERELNPLNMTGKPDVVVGFFSSNLGDVSPNTRGARCEFTGEPCDNHFLLCGERERCFSSGPGEDMFESTRIIGTAVFEAALDVLNKGGTELTGDIGVVHQFVNVPEAVAPKYDPVARRFEAGEVVAGCFPALGYSFASGTVDGANTLNITQGTLTGIPQLDAILAGVAGPTEEDIECHAPKPIILATGRATSPVPWHPKIISASLIWLGGLAVAGVPGEPTTMAGRRIKDVVSEVMRARGFEPRVVVSGLTNEYIHYITTFEEYQVQRYEAASTIYGPHTLNIFLNKFADLTSAVINGTVVDPGQEPEDHRANTISLISRVILDSTPMGKSFGEVLEQPPRSATVGELVSVTFVAANPRNNIRQESSHAQVERLVGDEWITVATDADWETKFHWERISTLFGTSRARFDWRVPTGVVPGPHRVVYHGTWRSLIGFLTHFTGVSDTFQVVS